MSHEDASIWVHLVTRGHFRSRDKDGGHTIGSAILVNSLQEVELLPIDVFALRE